MARDAEVRTSSGESKKQYVVFTLAVNDDFDKRQVDYIDFQIWNFKRGKYMADYGKKGMKVEVSGKLKTYINNDNHKQSYISVNTYEFLSRDKAEEKTETQEQETAF